MRTYIFFILFFYLLIFPFTSTYAQPNNTTIGGPSIPSASANSYARYANIPVNNYTGAANIDIPIAALSEGPLGHGISLNYHSAGNRIGSMASSVGLGWHLNAGGIITRIVQGTIDDHPNKGFYHKGNELDLNDLSDAAKGDIDSEPDIFTFNFNGHVGKFLFDRNGDIFMMPKSDIKIEPNLINSYFAGFTATTPDGTKYYFGRDPITNASAAESTGNDGNYWESTSWMLTRIESFDSKNFISFTYNLQAYEFETLPFCSATGYNDEGQQIEDNCSDDPYTVKVQGTSLLKTISSSTTTITFSYFNRTDLKGLNGGTNPLNGIDKIEVQNGNFCVEYDLIHDYFKDPSKSDFSSEQR